jgi:hypothetical protein
MQRKVDCQIGTGPYVSSVPLPTPEHDASMADKVGLLSMIIVGLAAHVVGQSYPISVGRIDVSLILSNAGLLVAFVFSYQWYFDTKVRAELSRDITRDVMGNVHIRDAGLRDIWLNSHDVDYKDAILGSPELIVGFRHSSSWISRHMVFLRQRCSANLTTHLSY